MGVRATVQTTLRTGEVFAEVMGGVELGLTVAAERLLALAVDRVPVDQGDLRNSGAVAQSMEGRGTSADVVFDTPYAARLHEHPEYHFATDSNPNAQGKYLESAAMENKAELGDIIRKQAHGG